MDIPDMKITTSSGAVYSIVRNFCTKIDKEGKKVDSFRVVRIKSLPDSAGSFEDIYSLEDSSPEVGKRMFICGVNSWWVTTKIAKIQSLA